MDDFKISEIANILRTTSSHIVDGDAEYNSKALEKFVPRLARLLPPGNCQLYLLIQVMKTPTNK